MYCGTYHTINLYSHLYNGLFHVQNIPNNHFIFGNMKKGFEKHYFQYCHCSIEDINHVRQHKTPNAFYAIILNDKRYFYLDCDLKIQNSQMKFISKIKQTFKISLIRCITNHFKITSQDIFGWDASRQKSKYFKISYHIVVPTILLDLSMIKQHAKIIKHVLSDIHFAFGKSIDMNVYHKLQAWRLPLCTNLDNNSKFEPFVENVKLTDVQQIQMNLLGSDKDYCLNIQIQKYLW